MSEARRPGPTPRASEHWTDYWAGGRLTSLPGDFAGNYDGEIAEFWSAQFRAVPEGGRILDVCTGNGAVALLAAGWFRDQGRAAEITGADAARIDPAAVSRAHPDVADLLEKVHFAGESSVERLDFPPDHFDLVTSQYGIEYSDTRAAAARLVPILRPGGRLVMVCHAVSSDILRTMAAEAQDYAALASAGLISGIRRFLAGNLSYPRFRKLIAQVGAALAPEYRLRRPPLFGHVLRNLEQLGRLDQAALRGQRLQLAAFGRDLELGRARLEDMLRVNRAIQSDPEWYRVFEDAGLALLDSREILLRGRHRAGQAYRFEKPRQGHRASVS